jgi:hypothetical protein
MSGRRCCSGSRRRCASQRFAGPTVCILGLRAALPCFPIREDGAPGGARRFARPPKGGALRSARPERLRGVPPPCEGGGASRRSTAIERAHVRPDRCASRRCGERPPTARETTDLLYIPIGTLSSAYEAEHLRACGRHRAPARRHHTHVYLNVIMSPLLKVTCFSASGLLVALAKPGSFKSW